MSIEPAGGRVPPECRDGQAERPAALPMSAGAVGSMIASRRIEYPARVGHIAAARPVQLAPPHVHLDEPLENHMPAGEIDADADERGMALAARLQQDAGDWFVVMWSRGLRRLVAIYCGEWEEGGLLFEAADPEELWTLMLPHIPAHVLAPRSVRLRGVGAVVGGRPGRSAGEDEA
jgi:hypothetical protein